MGIRDEVLLQIQEFRDRLRMDKSTFGQLCCGNPKLIVRIRKTDIRSSTIDRVRDFMKEYEGEKKKAKHRDIPPGVRDFP